jgi:23S rRNA (adenine-N6)-dimethyltransferase
MAAHNRKSLAQNFLVKPHLVAQLLNESSISPHDIVYEIGPGTGMITKRLGTRAKRVIAIEKDRNLYLQLRRKLKLNNAVIFYHADFLKFTIKESLYKIFSNIPFNITSAIIRKIVYAPNPPVEAYLILQKEAAEKFIGFKKTTQLSVLIKPWFRLTIKRYFKKTDFSPVPRVHAVMLHMKKRTPPLISPTDIRVFEKFIKRGFGGWRKNLKSNYKTIFTYNQWKILSRNLGFSIHAQPSELHFRQWLGLFKFFRRNIY